ncbi:GNAT family N-acetyltransferase, partial [uncultured Streptococcus sp.]|uniref:GNAT family N-acetyltransferase n=1 Tax=uncultured Streptococcus sp. TaxID=83427 RepID=UPI0035A8DC06
RSSLDVSFSSPTTVDKEPQLPAQAFYQNCGFVQEGQTFQEAGIDHTNMTRTL